LATELERDLEKDELLRIRCEGCWEKFDYQDELEEHYLKCPNGLTKCKCGEVVMRKDIGIHGCVDYLLA